jgi:hypothetical protein
VASSLFCTSLFLRSSLLNGSSKFTKQYPVHFVDDEKEKISKYSQTMSYKLNALCRSLSLSSPVFDYDNQEDFNSNYDQFHTDENHLQKPRNYTTKINYVDETSRINPKLMKKNNNIK